jgi:putative ABC transport system permease protein
VDFGTFVKDLRFGTRALMKQPGSAVVSVLVLSLGIGLSTFMFSIIYGVFFRGLDVPEPEQLMMIGRSDESAPPDNWFSWAIQDFVEIRERQTSFEGVAGYSTGTVNVAGNESPERFNGVFTTANLFDVLRVRPVIGRGFSAEEDDPGAPLTVVLGYRMWQDRYAGDRGVLGEVIRVNGEQATVIGVMPEGFLFPDNHEIYVAMRDDPLATERWQGRFLSPVGRLRGGIEWDQATLELAGIARRLEQEYPETNEGMGVKAQTFVESNTGPVLTALFGSMMVAVLFVLLVACANVANLLLARAAMRTKEAAVRVALGAGRLRVMFPFFSEAIVLATAGAVVGMGIAYYAVGLFDAATASAVTGRPYFMVFRVDFPILLFVVVLTGLTALAAGAAPALQVSRADVNGILKDESRGSSSFSMGRLSKILVIAEVALSCALLVGAGLMTKSIVQLSRYELPFEAGDYFSARVGLFETDYPEREDRQAFWEDLTRRLEAQPGVEAAGLTSSLPGNFAGATRIRIEGETYEEPQDRPIVHNAMVTPRFFDMMGVGLIEGEDFNSDHTEDTDRVAIVNRSFAATFWPGESPLGRRFRPGTADTIPWVRVIGMAPDLQMEGFQPAGQPGSQPDGYYVPISQYDPRFLSITAKPAMAEAISLTADVRTLVQELDPNLPIYNVMTVEEVIQRNSWFYSVFGVIFIVFGAAALFMASVGLYGVLAFSVNRRIQEMGIRMALGAGARDVVALVVRQGAVQMGIGLALGLAMAWGVSKMVAVVMFQVNPRDVSVYGAVVGVIVLVGIAASLIPARRATAVDPVVAIRYE